MFYIANLLYRFVGAWNLANQSYPGAFTNTADPKETFLMSRTATNFLPLALSADCRGYKQPAEGNTPLFLLGILPATDNQLAER